MHDAMRLRGPDGEGVWFSPNARVGLAHRRLAIIDPTDSGMQPMSTADGRFHITFNGEIYNYRELRRELAAAGYVMRSNSDTEVLLHLYADRGADMVHALRGMYAFAIYDAQAQSLFMARDPFGIKPLYYANDGSTVRFASQVKAMVAGGECGKGTCAAGYVGFFLWGHVPDPYTLHRDIKALPAGSTLLVSHAASGEPKPFFSVTEEFQRAGAARGDANAPRMIERLSEALRDTVRHHMVADVPVGLFLSSGLDSSALAGLACRETAHLSTITLGFREYEGTVEDETPLAAKVARRYDTAHQTRWVSKADFESHVDKLLDAMDQPTIDGVNVYFVSLVAARSGLKVALSGLGGDEIFGGYPSFEQVPRMVGTFGGASNVRGLGRAFRWVSAPVLKHFTSPKYAGLLEYGGEYAGAYLLRRGLYMPWELPTFLDPDLVKEGWDELRTLERLDSTVRGLHSDHQKVSALEMCWYMRNQLLRDSDWAGMAHSLEIRVPLVDVELFRTIAPWTVERAATKLDMARAPVPGLPAEVLHRPKTGFSVPIKQWLPGANESGERGVRSWARYIMARESATH
jgi:asparagine synthase (glutamine-hydrolysing)